MLKVASGGVPAWPADVVLTRCPGMGNTEHRSPRPDCSRTGLRGANTPQHHSTVSHPGANQWQMEKRDLALGEEAPALHSQSRGVSEMPRVTHPPVLPARHSPACARWHPAGTLCPRRSPGSCPSQPTARVAASLRLLGFPLAQIPVPPTRSTPVARRIEHVPVPSVSDWVHRIPPRMLRLERLTKSHLGRREPETAKE